MWPGRMIIIGWKSKFAEGSNRPQVGDDFVLDGKITMV